MDLNVDECVVSHLLATFYELQPLEGSIERLCGYSDTNVAFTDKADQTRRYVLKIVDSADSLPELTDIIDEILSSGDAHCSGRSAPDVNFFVPKLVRTSANKLSAYADVRFACASTGDHINKHCNIKLFEHCDGSTLLEFVRERQQFVAELEPVYHRLGQVAGHLFRFLNTQCHLREKLAKVREQTRFAWQVSTCTGHLRSLLERFYPCERTQTPEQRQRRELVMSVLSEFEVIRYKLQSYPAFILHGDLCSRNMLVPRSDVNGNSDMRAVARKHNDANQSVEDTTTTASREYAQRQRICVIDFQDVQLGQQVIELAVLCMYLVLEQQHTPYAEALRKIPRYVYLGYQSVSLLTALSDDELRLVPSLMKLRLCQSLLNGLDAYERLRDKSQAAYVLDTQQRGWALLELMCSDPLLSDPIQLTDMWRSTDAATDAAHKMAARAGATGALANATNANTTAPYDALSLQF